jgi:hypothetical protein
MADSGPSDDALVVRGGPREALGPVNHAAKRCRKKYGYPALSGWSIDGLSAEQIARQVGTKRLPHDEIRAVPAGKLRGAGYEVI